MATHPTPATGLDDSGPDSVSIPMPPLLLRELVEALQSIRFGTVELVIHDGRVVQLERREKVRFDSGVTDHRRL